MDIFTMVIMACVSGEATCVHARISESSFTSLEACEEKIDPTTRAMTRNFGARPDLKGRQVTYDVSCMDRRQLKEKLGVVQSDL